MGTGIDPVMCLHAMIEPPKLISMVECIRSLFLSHSLSLSPSLPPSLPSSSVPVLSNIPVLYMLGLPFHSTLKKNQKVLQKSLKLVLVRPVLHV